MSTTKYIVDNKAEQEIDGDLAISGDLAIDGDVNITGNTNIRPYKVYTALLTQSGGDDPRGIYEGELTIGVTYLINGGAIADGCDFTNVGAPNNNSGTYFVATGNTPNWGTTTNPDMLTYNTGAPVATVLENTLGFIPNWQYVGVGIYSINNVLFTNDKTTVNVFLNVNGNSYSFPSTVVSQNVIIHSVFLSDFTYMDSVLNNTAIEIRVYN